MEIDKMLQDDLTVQNNILEQMKLLDCPLEMIENQTLVVQNIVSLVSNSSQISGE